MKRIMGTILSCAFVAGSAHGGSIGGTSPGNASSLFYYPNAYEIFVPDYLDDYIVITKRGTRIDTDFRIYSLDSRDFGRLQNVADSYSYVNVNGSHPQITEQEDSAARFPQAWESELRNRYAGYCPAT
jgi:hypothetical protein